MARTLELIFETTANKAVTLTVDEPRSNLTAPELFAGMQTIIEQDVFEIAGAKLAAAKSARVVDRTIVEYTV